MYSCAGGHDACRNAFIQSLIDDYIKPMIAAKSTDFTPLAFAMLRLAIVYVVGLAASYAYNRIMVNVGQGTLRNFRNDLFTNMEKLPIKYFDTHQARRYNVGLYK